MCRLSWMCTWFGQLRQTQNQEHPAWLVRHPRLHVHFTPTSVSWLNQVARWFATLTEKYIRRAPHRSTWQLEQAIREYLRINNAIPKPFVCSKSADDILAGIDAFVCELPTQDTGTFIQFSPHY